MKFDSVIFDLDGTLLDTLEDLADGVNHALREYGLPERTNNEVRSFVGNGIRKLIERSVQPGTDMETIEAVHKEFVSFYGANCDVKTKPYAGVSELLEKLCAEGIPCAIVSNKADFAVRELSAKYFGDLCTLAIGEREGIARKPAPDSLFEAIRILGSKNPVYVGDSEVDIATSKNAAVPCIAVDWGFRSKNELISAGAKNICSTMSELETALEEM